MVGGIKFAREPVHRGVIYYRCKGDSTLSGL